MQRHCNKRSTSHLSLYWRHPHFNQVRAETSHAHNRNHHGTEINLAKCRFNQNEVNIFGFNISKVGIRPIKEKVDNILEMI